jgi:hypothetical protein
MCENRQRGGLWMPSEAGNGNRVYLKVGDAIRLLLPDSETCVRWGVAGKPVWVAIGEEGSADLLHDNGSTFPMPISVGEAGIRTDEAGHYYVPSSAVASPEAGLRPLPPQSLT